MYNAELKNQFLSEQFSEDKQRQTALYLFNSLEKYEQEWGADVCTRSAEELRPVVGELVGMRASSQKMRKALLKRYGQWCLFKNVPGACSGLLNLGDLSDEMLDKMKRQTVANPMHLQQYLDYLYTPESEKTADCVKRCYCWLAYAGVMEEQNVVNIHTDDVDLEAMLVKVGNESYPIYREALPAFRACAQLTEFTFVHPNYETKINRCKGTVLLRGIKGKVSVDYLRQSFSAAQRVSKQRSAEQGISMDLHLSYYRIWLSGLFYRMLEWERAGGPVDFMDTACRAMANKKHGSDTEKRDSASDMSSQVIIRSDRYTAARIANEYKNDYNRWKQAYAT